MCLWQPNKYLKGQRGTFFVAVTLQSIFRHCNLGKWMRFSKSCLIMFNQEERIVPALLIITPRTSGPRQATSKLILSVREEEGIPPREGGSSFGIKQAEMERDDFMSTFLPMYGDGENDR